jgi:hypothetical protein
MKSAPLTDKIGKVLVQYAFRRFMIVLLYWQRYQNPRCHRAASALTET